MGGGGRVRFKNPESSLPYKETPVHYPMDSSVFGVVSGIEHELEILVGHI